MQTESQDKTGASTNGSEVDGGDRDTRTVALVVLGPNPDVEKQSQVLLHGIERLAAVNRVILRCRPVRNTRQHTSATRGHSTRSQHTWPQHAATQDTQKAYPDTAEHTYLRPSHSDHPDDCCRGRRARVPELPQKPWQRPYPVLEHHPRPWQQRHGVPGVALPGEVSGEELDQDALLARVRVAERLVTIQRV